MPEQDNDVTVAFGQQVAGRASPGCRAAGCDERDRLVPVTIGTSEGYVPAERT